MAKCSGCDGTGKVDCGDCVGGQIECEGTCDLCDSSCGHETECSVCRGEGNVDCDDCGGSGEVND
jgi:RecJ-like exonuclease